jgi:hypothetical protein
VPIGDRDAVFYRIVARICQRIHRTGGTKEDAMAEAQSRNAAFAVPLDGFEVEAKVTYWWSSTVNGRNQFGTGHRPLDRGWEQELAGRDPALYALIGWLERENGPDAEFWIANGLVNTHLTGWWSLDRLRDARQRALDGKWIEKIVHAAQGRHALYRWGPTAMATIFA